MAIPAGTLPTWSEGGGGAGGALGNEPSGAKIAQGWEYSERPSPAFFNWWQGTVGKWISYLNSRTTRHERPVLTTWHAGPAANPWVGPSSAIPDYTWVVTNTAANIGQLHIPLDLDIGDRITGYTVRVRHQSTATADTIRCRLWKFASDGTASVAVGAVISSAASTAIQNLTEASLSIDVSGTDRYIILVEGNAGGSTPREVYEADVSVTVKP